MVIFYLKFKILKNSKSSCQNSYRAIARSNIQPILTEGRSLIETDTQEIIQQILDEYNSGIQIIQVQTQKLIHRIKLLTLLETFRLQEQIWKDLKMKPKLMLTM